MPKPGTLMYRRGMKPDFVKSSGDDVEFNANISSAPRQSDIKVKAVSDPRLNRLSAASAASQEGAEDRIARRRRVIEAAEVINGESNAMDIDVGPSPSPAPRKIEPAAVIIESSDLSPEERAARHRRAMLAAQRDEEEGLGAMPVQEEESEEEEEESEEDESSEGEWDFVPGRPLIQPRFVSKDQRHVDADDREAEEKLQEKRRQEAERLAQERKARTRQLLRDSIARDRTVLDAENGEDLVYDSDGAEVLPEEDEDDAEFRARLYEKWKLRELKRIRRDRQERDLAKREAEEAEMRRQLPDEAILQERIAMGLIEPEKKKIKFLQKYYHKGAFYSDILEEVEKDPTKEHDWLGATGEDAIVDKSVLPKVLQVKNFGLAGRTKYTHLVDQDTSRPDDPWAQSHTAAIIGKARREGFQLPGMVGKKVAPASGAAVISKKKRYMGGFGAEFERPAKRKKFNEEIAANEGPDRL